MSVPIGDVLGIMVALIEIIVVLLIKLIDAKKEPLPRQGDAVTFL